MDFYGWTSSKIAQEYISTSKAAVKSMAVNLAPKAPTVATEKLDRMETVSDAFTLAPKPSDPLEKMDRMVTEIVVKGSIDSLGDQDLQTGNSSKLPIFLGQEACSKLIQNNKQVFIVQNFNGNMNF